MNQRRTNAARHPFEANAHDTHLKSNSVLPANGAGREQGFDYRGPDFFNRNPGAKSSTFYGNLYGRHHGKGPKGYRRSDERIYDDIIDVLTEDPYVDASEIILQVHDGEIILGGTVNDRSQKRRAEDIIQYIRGVANVENRIRVCYPADAG